ncbi:MAG: hypothetical protein LBH32_03280 [Dysgonamonadaceae bacterium]|jgi:hypothetical protein|nr:hypothetical protein [Dysgonamonadaceae bacterium]
MKKISKVCINSMLISVLALSALWLSSCSHDEFPVDKPVVPGEKGTLSFILPLGGNKTVTYATNIPGLDAEYAIDNLRIFWFIQSGSEYVFKKAFKFEANGSDNSIDLSDYSLSATGNTTVATISVEGETTSSRFYLLANVGISGKPVQSFALDNMSAGTKSTVFETRFADALEADPTTGELTLLDTPLPMSISKSTSTNTDAGNGNGYVEVADPSAQGSVDGVHLKRRVARFDIINNADWSNFEVTRIIISRAQTTGWLHDTEFDASNLPSEWPAEGKTIIPGTNANGTPSSKVDQWNEKDPSNPGSDGIYDDFQNGGPLDKDTLREQVNRAIFYLWPTELKQNVDASGSEMAVTKGTEIVIEGKFYGQTSRLYRLNLTADQSIEANKIYRIKIKKLSQNLLKFDLITVDDWAEDVDVNTEPTQTFLDWSKASFSAKGGQLAAASIDLTQDWTPLTPGSYEYISTTSDSAKITIVTVGTNLTSGGHTTSAVIKAIGQDGTDFLASDLTDTKAYITSDTKLTYGTAFYTTTHTIILPPTAAPLKTLLEIVNPANDTDIKVIEIKSNSFKKAGKATVAMLLDGSLTSLGKGRWEKAVVTAVGTNGMPTQVYAVLGTSTLGDPTTIPDGATGSQSFYHLDATAMSPEQQLEYLNNELGQNIVYKVGETFMANYVQEGVIVNKICMDVIKLYLPATVLTGSDNFYPALVLNYNKAAGEIRLLASSGALNYKQNPDNAKHYINPAVTAGIIY